MIIENGLEWPDREKALFNIVTALMQLSDLLEDTESDDFIEVMLQSLRHLGVTLEETQIAVLRAQTSLDDMERQA